MAGHKNLSIPVLGGQGLHKGCALNPGVLELLEFWNPNTLDIRNLDS